MPDPLSRLGIQGNQRVSKQIIANAISAIEVKNSRSGGHIDNATIDIDRHAGPVVGGPGIFPRVLRPGVITKLARVGNGVERPAQGSGAYIKGSNVPGRRRVGFGVCPADNDQILVDTPGRGELDGLLLVRLAQSFAQVDSSLLTKTGNRLTGGCIERVEIIACPGEDAALMAIGPIRDAAAQHASFKIGLEFPDQLAGGRIERDHAAARGGGVENVANNDGIGLDATLFSGVILPR